MAGKGMVKTGGRRKGTPNRNTAEKLEATQDFFQRILDDEVEAKFWRYFMTGYVVDPESGSVIPIPVNPVTFQAFKRAVEYKRGMPVQPTEEVPPSGVGFGLGSIAGQAFEGNGLNGGKVH